MGILDSYDPGPLMAELRRRRERLGITQEEAAWYLGTSKSVISRIENGQRGDLPFGILVGLARLYGLDLQTLVRLAGLPPVPEGAAPEGAASEGAAPEAPGLAPADRARLQLLWQRLLALAPATRAWVLPVLEQVLTLATLPRRSR